MSLVSIPTPEEVSKRLETMRIQNHEQDIKALEKIIKTKEDQYYLS